MCTETNQIIKINETKETSTSIVIIVSRSIQLVFKMYLLS